MTPERESSSCGPRREAMTETVTSWGGLTVRASERRSENLQHITNGVALSRGLGRSYGDSSLPAEAGGAVVGTVLADRILGFDEATGVLRAEAGLSLAELNRVFLRRGWFTPVSPGTMFVTLGGMVAADVHGKNHHQAGCFGAHVLRLKMRVADGRIVECSREQHADLFLATLGGMGLTGHVLEVEFKMTRVASPWILAETEQIENIDQFITGLKQAGDAWPMTVGWIDCLSRGRSMGRGILMRGRWATAEEAPAHHPKPLRRITVPFDLPEFLLCRPTVRLFNECYYRAHGRGVRRRILHPEKWFYPLDAILHWNRIYGRRGFTQYQCLLPERGGRAAIRRFFELLTAKGGASFLCVIKDHGDEGDGMLSFPMRGTSIALDMAVRDDTPAIVDALNACVIEEGGRVYLAKDRFTREPDFRAMEPRLAAWERVRQAWDPQRLIRSAQSVRLLGDRV
jgi:decaprenylphospho-beta-D-ribofuranose 2-oxidase